MRFQRMGFSIFMIAPDMLQQISTLQLMAGGIYQGLQQGRLTVGQLSRYGSSPLFPRPLPDTSDQIQRIGPTCQGMRRRAG